MRYLLVPALAVMSACSGQPQHHTTYLLRADPPLQSRQFEPSAQFAFGSLEIAGYLDHPGLVLETRAGEVRAARYHQWAEPLRDSVKTLLQTEISRHIGQDLLFGAGVPGAARIDIIIDRMHGNAAGEAVLVGYWRLHRPRGEDAIYQFAARQPLAADGYHALAAAERALLLRLAEQIAQVLTVAAGDAP
jgi:uncharacterized lipoprotein YmbA